MKTTVAAILNSGALLQEISQTKMSIGMAYRVKKLVEECSIISQDFDAKRVELLKKHAKLDEKKQEYRFDPKDKKGLEAFNTAIQEIASEEVDLTTPQLKLEELEGLIEIEPAQFPNIEWFIEDVV